MAFLKQAPADHPQATMVEAAGLRWLAQAAQDGGAPVVPVLAASPGEASAADRSPGPPARRGELRLQELTPVAPDPEAARDFGAALARTHGWLAAQTTDAPGFGALPPEHPARTPAYFGPADQPVELGTGVHDSWGAFLAAERLDPVLAALESRITREDARLLRSAREKISSGALDDAEPPALIHGDLWAGNVVWASTDSGQAQGVLIDPAAHTGHRETDIALLHLFGLPQLDAVISGYQQQHALREGWQERIPLHQLFCLSVHWLLFGASYSGPTLSAAESVLELASRSSR